VSTPPAHESAQPGEVTLGYALSSEEFGPEELVEQARMAEAAGFAYALISDHFHPWVGAQGQSPNVWPVLGAIAGATAALRVGTGVTCPIIRQHPAVVAHAAATVARLMPGRFFLGAGTGENLNEHVVGAGWPPPGVRLDMLEEAIEICRALWEGDEVVYRGAHFDIEHARLYTTPGEAIPVVVAAGKAEAAMLAGRVGDGLVTTSPDGELVSAYRKSGGVGPTYGQMTVCWNEDEAEARRIAHETWPNAALPGDLSQELERPAHFEQAAKLVREEDVAELVVCGPDPEPYRETIAAYAEAGLDHVYIHQVGPDQAGFLRFAERELLGSPATTSAR
jgi:coenzyme F420-dependent glucose-6-phosphate dehydrogenase